jgi:hypothetical protein
MDLDKGFELLHAKCPDYARYHKDIAAALNLPNDTPLRTYLELINNDVFEWFKSFPMQSTSIEALAKPKTALLFWLEKCDDVRTEMTPVFCNSMAENISREWKKHSKALVEERKVVQVVHVVEVEKAPPSIRDPPPETTTGQQEDSTRKIQDLTNEVSAICTTIHLLKDVIKKLLPEKGESESPQSIALRMVLNHL